MISRSGAASGFAPQWRLLPVRYSDFEGIATWKYYTCLVCLAVILPAFVMPVIDTGTHVFVHLVWFLMVVRCSALRGPTCRCTASWLFCKTWGPVSITGMTKIITITMSWSKKSRAHGLLPPPSNPTTNKKYAAMQKRVRFFYVSG